MFSLAGFLVLATTTVTTYVLHQLFTHPLAAYPGPFVAKFTNFWRFFKFSQGAQHLVDRDLHARYGRIVRDGPNSLLVADVEVFKSIYGFNKAVEKGDFYKPTESKDSRDPNIFPARSEAQHTQAKKQLVPPALSAKNLMQYEPYVTRNVKAYLAYLSKAIYKNGGRLDVAPTVERFTFDTMLETAYGSSMGFIEAGYDKFGTIADKNFIFPMTIAAGHVPWLSRLLASKTVGNFLRKPQMDKEGSPKGFTAPTLWSSDIIDNAAKNSETLQPSILKSLLEVPESDMRKPSLPFIIHECLNVHFAGTGSSAAALNSILYEFACHPEWQSPVHSELQSLSPDDHLSNASLSTLPKLQAFMKEALRVHPPFSAPFERVIGPLSGTVTLPGLETPIPPGTRLWSNPYIICRSEVFGPEADQLRPERWLDSPPEQLKEMEDVYCIFGRGSRGCVGKDLAWMVLRKATAGILRDWSVECNPGALQGRNAFEMHYKDLFINFVQRSDVQ